MSFFQVWHNSAFTEFPVVAAAAIDASLNPEYLQSMTGTQTDDVFARYTDAVNDELPKERDEAIREYNEKHINAVGVECASLMSGVCARTSSLNKRDRVALLVGVACPPIRISFMRKWIISEVDASIDVAVYNAERRAMRAEELRTQPSLGTDDALPAGGVLTKEMKAVLDYMCSRSANADVSNTAAGGQAILPSSSSQSPGEKHVAKMVHCIVNNNYTDPHMLGVEYVHAIRLQDRAPTQSTQLAPGLFVNT